jgi:phosphatidylglycerophosphate synthase
MTSSVERWLPLAPAAVVSLYFVIGLLVFAVRSMLWGVRHDRELEARGRSILIGNFLKSFFSWIIQPLWRLVLASGISPNGITVVAMIIGGGAGVAVATGHFALGGWLFLLSGILDTFDGRLARARNQVTPVGAAFDSLLDRYADGAMLIGLAFYFRGSWVLLPALAAIFGTSMVPYVRAKAESFGVAMKDGLMQRPERVLTLGMAVVASPWVDALSEATAGHPPQRLVAVCLVLLAITSNTTAVGRIMRLLATLRSQAQASPAVAGSQPGAAAGAQRAAAPGQNLNRSAKTN